MRIVWTREAIRDLVAIRHHIAREDPAAARAVARRITDAVDALRQMPFRGRPGRIPGTRALVVAGTAYLVPYRPQGERPELLRVLHGRRQWPEDP